MAVQYAKKWIGHGNSITYSGASLKLPDGYSQKKLIHQSITYHKGKLYASFGYDSSSFRRILVSTVSYRAICRGGTKKLKMTMDLKIENLVSIEAEDVAFHRGRMFVICNGYEKQSENWKHHNGIYRLK